MIDVYPLTIIQAAMISRVAVTALDVRCSVVSMGYVSSVPSTPNDTSNGLRPYLSESAP